MTRETQAVFKKALALPFESKADLVELLLNCIEEDSTARQRIDKAWAKEARDRFGAFLHGDLEAYPMPEVLEALKKRHAR
jgi:hypothetical protein